MHQKRRKSDHHSLSNEGSKSSFNPPKFRSFPPKFCWSLTKSCRYKFVVEILFLITDAIFWITHRVWLSFDPWLIPATHNILAGGSERCFVVMSPTTSTFVFDFRVLTFEIDFRLLQSTSDFRNRFPTFEFRLSTFRPFWVGHCLIWLWSM